MASLMVRRQTGYDALIHLSPGMPAHPGRRHRSPIDGLGRRFASAVPFNPTLAESWRHNTDGREKDHVTSAMMSKAAGGMAANRLHDRTARMGRSSIAVMQVHVAAMPAHGERRLPIFNTVDFRPYGGRIEPAVS